MCTDTNTIQIAVKMYTEHLDTVGIIQECQLIAEITLGHLNIWF